MNHFDQASRLAAKLDGQAYLAWLFQLPVANFEFHRWLDTRGLSVPGQTETISDTVASLVDLDEGGVPWAVVIEFQSRPDPEMFGRLLKYMGEIWQSCRPDEERGSRFHVGAVIVNLSGTGTTRRKMSWPGAGLLTHVQPIEINLESMSAADLLGGIESGTWSRALLPWIPLMVGGDESDTIDR